jgi:spore coat protein U-like protein
MRARALTRTAAFVWAALALGGGRAAHAAVSCDVTSTGVSFGVYDLSLSTPTDSAGAVDVTCTYVPPGGGTQVSYVVTLSTGFGASYSSRAMPGPAGSLPYNLYVDTARTVIWGNGLEGTGVTSGGLTVGPGIGNGTRSESHTIYGRIPAQQAVAEGNYLDTITVTITF